MNQLISVGDKIELKQIPKQTGIMNEEVRTYVSQVLDINDYTLLAALPSYEGHLVPLEVGTRYETFFKTEKGLFKSVCEVVSRSKVEKIYMLELKPLSGLEKFQRRQFFRLITIIDANICSISELEMKKFLQDGEMPEDYDNKKNSAVIIDISGGGVKMVSNNLYQKKDFLLMEFCLYASTLMKNIIIAGKVITSSASDNRHDLNEHRVEYYQIPKEIREVIIKYIFDEQRRIRKKERG
jgi:c-di-GMP-binding flagellar brake protein YcgR